LAGLKIGASHRETGDGDRLASQRLSALLVLEESSSSWSSAGNDRGEGADSTLSAANPGWGAPRIHGELGKLGINVSETTVAKYMVRHRHPQSQTWRTFLSNHVKELVSADFFVVPTATFRLLFVFIILSHDRR
jgi:hypothetical protein